jgi:hypothetical protein
MRRLWLAALGAALLLAGCGTQAPPKPALTLGLIGEPLGGAPALLAERSLPLPLHIARGAAARKAPYLIAPSSTLPQLAKEGWVALGAICATPPDVLLWHQNDFFGWSALDHQSLYIAPGADQQALETALARYRGVLTPSPTPVFQQGAVGGFEADPSSFLLAPEPLAADLLVNGQAELAQALPDELGPYPSCLVLARTKVMRQDPLLTVDLLRALNLGLWRLATQPPGRLALVLRPRAPATSPAGFLRSILAARSELVFNSSVTLSAEVTASLEREFARGDLPDGALDAGPSLRALRDPFHR